MTEVVEEKITEEASDQVVKSDLKYYVQQLSELKQELIERLQKISERFPVANEDLIYIKDTLKAEVTHVFEDVTKTSKEIKEDLVGISIKHKDHLLETFKQSKEHTVEAFSKLKSSDTKVS